MICSYTEINPAWGSDKLEHYLSLLPAGLSSSILRKKHKRNQWLSLCSKLLLKKLLLDFAVPKTLAGLKYDRYSRPYVDGDFDFNISHSGNIVICCGTMKGKAGIDIEKIKPVHFEDFEDYFTANEWQVMDNSDDKLAAFFNLWTRKEAVLKALGTGLYIPLTDIDVSIDTPNYNGIPYYLSELKIATHSPCHIAMTVEQEISMYAVEF